MKKNISLLIVFLFLSISICAQTMPAGADAKIWAQALKLHKKAIVIDGHNDIPTPMIDEDFDLATSSVGKFHKDGDPFHTDLERFKKSGLTGEFFSIYIAARYADPKNHAAMGSASRRALDMIDVTYRAIEKYPNQLTYCTTAAEIRRAKKAGKLCVLMGIEGGHAIEDSLFTLREFYRLGVRYMTLTHNNTNNWADACCDTSAGGNRHGGLSDFGREVIKEMNRLGMLVDLSHVSDETMLDALEVSTAPVIYSHSSARAVADHKRNVPDDILKRVAQNGGVVMVNFYPAFIDARNRQESNQRSEKLKPQLDALKKQYGDGTEAYNEAQRKLYAENPVYVPSYTRIVDHIDQIVKTAGIDYVGIGSDYDGIPLLPEGMQGMEDTVLLTYEMLKRGYSEKDVRKVLGENFLRVFEKAEKVAGARKISGDGSLVRIKK